MKQPKLRQQLKFESLEPRMLLAAWPVITEFLARNDSTLLDGDGQYEDWIELYNGGDADVDLQGCGCHRDHD